LLFLIFDDGYFRQHSFFSTASGILNYLFLPSALPVMLLSSLCVYVSTHFTVVTYYCIRLYHVLTNTFSTNSFITINS
jgi:hypothetical protein